MKKFSIYFLLIGVMLQSAIAQQKNVVLIIVDDLKPLINSFGESQMITPNLDKLASESAVFTNAHCQQAVCAPSRVSFMTGMRPDYTKVWDLKTKMRDMNPDILTMPQYFRQNGYQTIGMGKVLHGARKNDKRSWTVPYIEDTDLTYAEGYRMPANKDYQSEEAQKLYDELASKYPGDPNSDKVWLAVNKEMKKMGVRQSMEAEDVPDDAYADGAIALESIKQMEKQRKARNPFFIAIGFHKPHLPFVAPKKYWDLYNRDELELASFQEHAAGSPRFAYYTFGELKNYSDIPPNLTPEGAVQEVKQRELIHGYYAAVSYVDAQIGKVMDYLEKSGLKENSTIVLIGDHGWHLGDHGLWNKHSNFEQATRTPMIILAPGQTKARQITAPEELVDVFPTVCDFSGLKIPNQLQGVSLKPIVTGEEDRLKDAALSQYPRGDRMGYALRNDRYRLVEWHQGGDAQKGIYNPDQVIAVELYDYENDPLEMKSLAENSQYSAVITEMRDALKNIIEQ